MYLIMHSLSIYPSLRGAPKDGYFGWGGVGSAGGARTGQTTDRLAGYRFGGHSGGDRFGGEVAYGHYALPDRILLQNGLRQG
jgi:hypothetical protein